MSNVGIGMEEFCASISQGHPFDITPLPPISSLLFKQGKHFFFEDTPKIPLF